MGWIATLCTWFMDLATAADDALKWTTRVLLSKIYLLILPFFAVLKLVFDFCRATVDTVIVTLEGLEGFHAGGFSLPETISFVNSFFPIDEIFISAAALFTFFIGCQIIATIRGIKQTLLF